MTDGEVIFEVGTRSGERFLDGDRFDPGNRKLIQGIASVLDPLARPLQVVMTRHRVVMTPVANAEVVGRGRDDDINRSFGQPAQNVKTVPEAKRNAARPDWNVV
jgi:hypothetical protein